MKVKKLIELLQAEDPEREVIMSRDSEGNSYSPLDELSTCSYRTLTGEMGLELSDLTSEARSQGYSEEDVPDDGVPTICLWPEC